MVSPPYPSEFYSQNACIVARELIGALLVRRIDGKQITARIVETEAYTGQDDLASHGRVGRTPRNAPMWESPGHAYVYLCYGMYWLFNIVCQPVGEPAAVLVRAVEPLEGKDIIAQYRAGRPQKNWTNGPGRLTQALGIDASHNGHDLKISQGGLWIEPGKPIPDQDVLSGARVGLGRHVKEPWFSMPWRWWLKNNPHVSR